MWIWSLREPWELLSTSEGGGALHPLPTPNWINCPHILPGVGSAQDPQAPITGVTGAEGAGLPWRRRQSAGEGPAVRGAPPPPGPVRQGHSQVMSQPRGPPNTAAAADFTKSVVLLTPQWVSFSAGVVAIWGFWALAHRVTQGPTE